MREKNSIVNNNATAVFTTFITHSPINNGASAFFQLDEHIARLLHDAKQCGLSNVSTSKRNPKSLRAMVFDRVAEFLSSFEKKVEQVRVRLSLSSDDVDLSIDSYTNPWENLPGIKAHPVVCQRQIPELKTALIQESQKARRTAERNNCHEAILIDHDGILREGAWTNVFWVDEADQICTCATGVLPGITRALILSMFKVKQLDCRADEVLANAKEMFVTQSTSGVTAVLEVAGQAIADGKLGSKTASVQNAYRDCIRERAEFI